MLLETLQNDLTQALKSGDKQKTATLRFLIAGVKKYEIDTYLPGSKATLTDADVLKIVQKQIKTHKESIEAFKKGGREDLVNQETAELRILETYAPAELTDTEIKTIVDLVKASGIVNFGQMMGTVMKQIAGRASGDRVQKIVKEELS